MRQWVIMFFSVALLFPSTALSVSLRDLAADLCPQFGVSPDLALRVMRIESGCEPHALGVQVQGHHQGYFPSDHQVAAAMLRSALAVTRNVGIGAMQINWRAWGTSLGITPEALLDPETNIMVGCGLLGRHLQGQGTLIERVGRYHSATRKLLLPYGKRIMEARPCDD